MQGSEPTKVKFKDVEDWFRLDWLRTHLAMSVLLGRRGVLCFKEHGSVHRSSAKTRQAQARWDMCTSSAWICGEHPAQILSRRSLPACPQLRPSRHVRTNLYNFFATTDGGGTSATSAIFNILSNVHCCTAAHRLMRLQACRRGFCLLQVCKYPQICARAAQHNPVAIRWLQAQPLASFSM